jgi:hypothetical protein
MSALQDNNIQYPPPPAQPTETESTENLIPYDQLLAGQPQQQPQAAPGAQTPTAPQMPMYGNGMMGSLKDIFGGQEDALTKIAKANQEEANNLKLVYENQVKAQQEMAKYYNDKRDSYMKDSEAISKEIAAGKIDPSRKWNSMSTGNKILAGISLMVGGVGAALSKQQTNLAAEHLDNVIKADIEAQKSNLNNKHTLLAANFRQMGNLNQAELMTRMQASAIVQGQIFKFAAQSQGAKAMPQAQLMIQQLRAQQLPLIQKLAEMQMMSQISGAGTKEGGLPVDQELPWLKVVPEYSKHRVEINGRVYRARTPENANYVENLQTYVVPIKQKAEELKNLAKLGTRNPFSENHQRAVAIIAELKNLFAKKNGGFQPSHGEMKILEEALDNPTKLSTLFSDTSKYKTVIKGLDEELESNYKTKLFGYRGASDLDIVKPTLKGR